MSVGGCTWQWLQRTAQQPMGQSCLLTPNVSQPRDPRHAHAHQILSQHIKQTRRLLRLLRHALSKHISASPGGSSALHGSELPGQLPAAAPKICNPTSEELAASGHISSSAAASNCAPSASCQSAAATAFDSATAQASSALRGAASAAVADSSADHAISASTQAEDPSTAAGRDSSSVFHSAFNKAALFSQAKPSTQTTILVEAVLPDQQFCANLCHTPCLLNFSIAPQILGSYSGVTLQTNASTAVPEGIDTKRELAEQLVRQHVQSSKSGWNSSAPIQLSSSIKVSHLYSAGANHPV